MSSAIGKKNPRFAPASGRFQVATWVMWGSKFNGTGKQRSASKCIRPSPASGPRLVYSYTAVLRTSSRTQVGVPATKYPGIGGVQARSQRPERPEERAIAQAIRSVASCLSGSRRRITNFEQLFSVEGHCWNPAWKHLLQDARYVTG